MTLFKDLFSAFGRSLVAKQSTSVRVRANVLNIKVDGNHEAVEALMQRLASGGISIEEAVRLLMSQTGLAENQSRTLVESFTTTTGTLGTSQQSTQTGHGERVTRPVTMTTCSKCHRKVPESARCLYCGQTLEAKSESSKAANEVDKKFLQTDLVEHNESTEEQEKQQLKDTYEDRLRNL